MTITSGRFARATAETILVREVKAKVSGARVLVRTSGKKTKLRVVKVVEAFVSIDKLEIAAEGVTGKGKNCKITTDKAEVAAKRLKIVAQSIVIQPL